MLKRVSAEIMMPLRLKVLRPDGPKADCVFLGDGNPSSYHLGFYDGPLLSGIGSVIQQAEDGQLQEGGVWRIRGMAVEPSYRGQGIGSKILENLVEHVSKLHGAKIWCNARSGALSLYQKHQFEIVSEEFMLPAIGPHFKMLRKL